MKVGVIWKGVGELANQLIGMSSHQEHLQPILNYLKAVNHVFRLVPYLPVLNSTYIHCEVGPGPKYDMKKKYPHSTLTQNYYCWAPL